MHVLWFHIQKEIPFCFACQGKTWHRTMRKLWFIRIWCMHELLYCLVFCTNPTFVWYSSRLTHDIKINNCCSFIQWKKDSGWSWPRYPKTACQLRQAAKKCKDKGKTTSSVSKAQTRSPELAEKASQTRRDDTKETGYSLRPRTIVFKHTNLFFYFCSISTQFHVDPVLHYH